MDLEPLQDYAKIQLDEPNAFSAKAGDTATDGILVALPKKFTHYGFYSFAFESSLGDEDTMTWLHDYWENFIGQRVYWLALSEKGAILKEADGTRYAYVKLTSLMAVGKAEEHAESVLDKNNGSFAA